MLRAWLAERFGEPPAGVVIDNGSGLSRDTRLRRALLARAAAGTLGQAPMMRELMSSLPVNGLDGTLRTFTRAPPAART